MTYWQPASISIPEDTSPVYAPDALRDVLRTQANFGISDQRTHRIEQYERRATAISDGLSPAPSTTACTRPRAISRVPFIFQLPATSVVRIR